MRLVIQRVTEARVTVDGEVQGAINKGLMVLIGISRSDVNVPAGVKPETNRLGWKSLMKPGGLKF